MPDPDRRPGTAVLRIRPCGRCGVYVLCRASRVYCDDCRLATRRARDQGRIRRQNLGRSRRELLALRARLLEASGGRCGICHLAIDATLRWPHPLSATLDHIVPLSAGGSDAEENLWPAHLRCNLEKGDDLGYRPDSALFGVAS